jgi:[CysO sulfur-carrier protein]-S-L-cysteine hydrolase
VSDKAPTPADWSAAAEAGAGRRRLSGMPAGLNATLPANLLQKIVDAAREDMPNETVGLLVADRYAADGGVPTRYVRMRNAAASPYRYLLDPDEQLRVFLEIDDADAVVWGIVHSHVASPAVPSATDVGLAFYPDSLYLVCSLAGEVPEVRGWTIRDGEVSEVPLAVS